MLTRLLVSLSVLATWTASEATAESLTLDKEASKIEFVGKKADGKHDGGFKKFTSKATLDEENPQDSTLVITIDASSLWSDNPKLTNHLKNPDFFDVRKHPEITFVSKKIVVDENKQSRIVGELTMLGKTVVVEIPVKAKVSESEAQIDATFVIDRTKWGMDYGQGKVNNDVDVKAHLVFKR